MVFPAGAAGFRQCAIVLNIACAVFLSITTTAKATGLEATEAYSALQVTDTAQQDDVDDDDATDLENASGASAPSNEDSAEETVEAATSPNPPGEVGSDTTETDATIGETGTVLLDNGPNREDGSGKERLEDPPQVGSSDETQTANQPIIGPLWLNTSTRVLCFVVLAFLAIASIVGRYLANRPSEAVNPALVRRFRQRVNAWWLMCAILVFGLLFRSIGTVILFGFVSFWALREFITMAPTRRGDHRALFWALIVFTPLQYVLIAFETLDIRWGRSNELDYYGLYSILIPVYASIFLPARIALSGDPKRFLERSAQITVGLLICVYALSYAPALVNLDLTYSDGTPWKGGSQAGLLFFFILVSQLSDVLQWVWGQLVGRRAIAAEVSSSRTWEGFIGGTLSSGLVGGALCWVTPFQAWEAMSMAMIVSVMGTFGGMTMSAIKRDRGVNDYGSLVMGHAGVLDRIDTLCFAAPVFYHVTRIFFSA